VKFTGQVRVPEIDHPGVPATILVEDDQAEVFLEGESLGRWSLFDVQASRLVSSAFELSMDGEEITFIADEPVDFAYKGVDHMAEVWARYKTMTIPRRVVAVGRSRRGTVPSRIGELRAAMLQNLEAAGRGVPRLTPIERVGQALPEPHHAPIEEPLVFPEPVEEERFETAVSEPIFRPSPVEEVAPLEDQAPAATPTPPAPRLRPGPGLFARRTFQETGPVVSPEPVFAPPEVSEPLSRSSWDEPIFEELEAEPDPVLETPEPVFDRGPVFEEPEPVFDQGPVFEEPEPEPEPEPDLEPEQLESVLERSAEPMATEVPELVKELLSTSSDEGGEEGARDLVVDLGHYEARRRPDSGPEDEPPAPQAAKQPVLTGAPAAPPERSGLLGAVRSAFARNKVPHEHEFVEAPGGIGIVRQICAECGYISIGVSD
jgi:hypothetical protein